MQTGGFVEFREFRFRDLEFRSLGLVELVELRVQGANSIAETPHAFSAPRLLDPQCDSESHKWHACRLTNRSYQQVLRTAMKFRTAIQRAVGACGACGLKGLPLGGVA